MRFILIIILLSSILICDNLTEIPSTEPQKVSLVLSGGGAQGLAHIGVLKAFEEYKIPIDLIVGTSAGALVGGLYSSGVSVEQLEIMAKDGTIMKLFLGRNELSDIPVWQRDEISSGKFSIRKSDERVSGPPGLLNDQLIWRDLFLLTASGNQLAKSKFDSLYIPFRAIGADVLKQESVIIDSGSLAQAIRISMSIPMVYPAVVDDGRILIDGGIYNNMPTDIARNLGSDFIIAVNVDDIPLDKEKLTDIFDYFDLFSSVFFSPTDSLSISDWDYFINVNTDGFNIFDFSAGEALIDRGYDAGCKAAKNLRKTINRQQNFVEMSNRQQQFQNALLGKSISQIQWVNQLTGKIINGEYEIDTPFIYSTDKIQSIINALYATNTYELIIPELLADGNTLRLIVHKKAKIQLIPEIKISSVDGFNLSGDWDYRFAENQYSLRSKIGLGNYKNKVAFTLSSNKYISPHASYKFKHLWRLNAFGNYQVLKDGNNNSRINHFHSGFELSAHQLLSWNQQFVAVFALNSSYWGNFYNSTISDNYNTVYPTFNLKYENNHIRHNKPSLEGWKIDLNFISGLNNSNVFTGLQGHALIGIPFGNKYNFSIDCKYRTIDEQAPLEFAFRTNIPTAFTNNLVIDAFAYSSLDISFNITRTFFREDVFVSLQSYNSYLQNRIINTENNWVSGIDLSIKYESILGPIELGWSVFNSQDYEVVSWTKLHIYL
jgi:predicted acylesterase/phospholipase RssA